VAGGDGREPSGPPRAVGPTLRRPGRIQSAKFRPPNPCCCRSSSSLRARPKGQQPEQRRHADVTKTAQTVMRAVRPRTTHGPRHCGEGHPMVGRHRVQRATVIAPTRRVRNISESGLFLARRGRQFTLCLNAVRHAHAGGTWVTHRRGACRAIGPEFPAARSLQASLLPNPHPGARSSSPLVPP